MEAVKMFGICFGAMLGIVLGSEAGYQVQRYIRNQQADEDAERLRKAAEVLADAQRKITHARNNNLAVVG